MTADNNEWKRDASPAVAPEPRAAAAPEAAPEVDEDIDQVPLFRRKRVVIPVFLFIVGAAIVAWYWYMNYRGYDSTDDAYIDGNRVSISSKMLGRIAELGADEGDTVKAGDTLVVLDDTDLRAQEKQAQAALVSAEENVKLAAVNLSKAEDDYKRAQSQYAGKVIPQDQFDHALKAVEAARAQQAIAVAQVGSAKAQLGVVETNLQNTVITSPMDGVVAKRWLLTGDVAQPGQPIFAVYDVKHVWVTANFEETKMRSLAIGAPVEINVDAYPKRRFTGRVFQLGTNTAAQFSLIPPNNASGNFTKITQRVPVKISIDEPADPADRVALLPGMSVEVKVKKVV
jgi:membrane fusion protein (multidrug efflux system)